MEDYFENDAPDGSDPDAIIRITGLVPHQAVTQGQAIEMVTSAAQ